MPLLLVTSLDTHWTCPYTSIVLQWICGLCGIIDWLLYPVLIGWNVVQILSLVHLVMTINVFIIPLSRPHSAYLHWQASIQFLFQRYVWCIGSNNLTSAHGGDLLAKSQIYWRINLPLVHQFFNFFKFFHCLTWRMWDPITLGSLLLNFLETIGPTLVFPMLHPMSNFPFRVGCYHTSPTKLGQILWVLTLSHF
jgi:hypothetical protein